MMPIVLDASVSSILSRATPNTSYSFSHTVGGGLNTVLFGMAVTLANTATDQTAFSATYNGVSMTKIDERSFTGKYMSVAAFYLIRPATGAHNIAFSWTGNSGGLFMARSYFGVSQSEPYRTGSWSYYVNTGNPTVNVPTSTGDVILDGMCGYSVGVAGGTGHTQLYEAWSGSDIDYGHIGHVPTPGSSPHTIGWTVGNWAVMGAFSIKAAGNTGGVAISPAMIF